MSLNQPTATGARVILTSNRWTRVLLGLSALYVTNFIDRNNLGFAVIGGMEKDLHIGAAQSGLAGGIFALGYIILQVPSGILVEKFDANRLLMLFAVAWGAVATAMGLVQNLTELLVLRFLLGLIDGGVWTMILVVLTRWFPEKERATANSIWLMCLPLSFIIMGPISGLIIAKLGWRALFILEGIPAIVIGILYYATSASRPEQASWLSPAELEYITAGQEADALSRSQRGQKAHANIRQVILDPRVILLSIIYCLWIIGGAALFMWVPAIMQSLSKQGMAGVGVISTLPYLAALLGLFVVGRLSDRTGRRSPFVAIALFGLGLGLLLSVLVPSPMLSVVLLTLAGTFLFAFHAPFWAIPAALFPPQQLGVALGMISLVGNIGTFVGPYMVGYVRQTTGSFTDGVLFLVASLWIAALLTRQIRHFEVGSSTVAVTPA